jgi:hypothetical protein
VFKAHRPRGNRDFAGEIISFLDELADIPLETRRDPLEPGDVAADNSELHPMSPNRVRWEHIHRVYEMCGRNAGLAQYARQVRRCMFSRRAVPETPPRPSQKI